MWSTSCSNDHILQFVGLLLYIVDIVDITALFCNLHGMYSCIDEWNLLNDQYLTVLSSTKFSCMWLKWVLFFWVNLFHVEFKLCMKSCCNEAMLWLECKNAFCIQEQATLQKTKLYVAPVRWFGNLQESVVNDLYRAHNLRYMYV